MKVVTTLTVLKDNLHFTLFGVSFGTWLTAVPTMSILDQRNISIIAAGIVTIIAALGKARKDNAEADLNYAKAEILREGLGDPEKIMYALQNQCIEDHCPYRRDNDGGS